MPSRENRNAPDSPDSSQTIPDDGGYDLKFSLVGKIWDGRETVKSPTVRDFPRYENQAFKNLSFHRVSMRSCLAAMS